MKFANKNEEIRAKLETTAQANWEQQAEGDASEARELEGQLREGSPPSRPARTGTGAPGDSNGTGDLPRARRIPTPDKMPQVLWSPEREASTFMQLVSVAATNPRLGIKSAWESFALVLGDSARRLGVEMGDAPFDTAWNLRRTGWVSENMLEVVASLDELRQAASQRKSPTYDDAVSYIQRIGEARAVLQTELNLHRDLLADA